MIQICLNMPEEGNSIRQVMNASSNDYLLRSMQYLATLKSPILLRIGGEMNVFTIQTTPDEFKSAYIKIAQYARDHAPNVALVFSPNSISSWGMSYLDYYPGDEFVDWVGLSAYTNLYRDPYNPYGAEDFEEMFYGSGDYSHPIRNLQEIVNTFGDHKPIIISESGSAHTHQYLPDLNGTLQQFSQEQLRKLYSYATMVYPQIKAIISFDALVGEDYTYSITANSTLLATYQEVTQNNDSLISSVQSQNTKGYVPASSYHDNLNTLSLAAYSAPVGVSQLEVRYFLNETIYPSESTLPFVCDINTSVLAQGTHSLQVEFSGDSGFMETKYYALEKSGDLVSLREESSAVNSHLHPSEDSQNQAEAPTVSSEEILPSAQRYQSYFAQLPSTETVLSGSLPRGLGIYPDGSLGGVPTETGTFSFTIATEKGEQAYSLTVLEHSQTGGDFSILSQSGEIHSNEASYQIQVQGEASSLLKVYLDGNLLLENIDYLVEGNTTLTLIALSHVAEGTHVLHLTFATPEQSSPVQVKTVTSVFEKTVAKSSLSPLPFLDVPEQSWYHDPILFMYQKGTFSGTSPSLFSPEDGMSRSMMAVVLYALAQRPDTESAHCPDVPEGQWYSNAVNWLLTTGISQEAQSFRPLDFITREETALFLYRFCLQQEITLPLVSSGYANDLESVSPSCLEAVKTLLAQKIFAGDNLGNFNPLQTSTRGEISTVMKNFISLLP